MNETGQQYEAPTDRTVENMIAAAAHIRDAIQHKIDEDSERGKDTSAKDIVSLVETIRATYGTLT